MAFAIDTYTGNGSTTSFSVTFPYITTADVVVTVDGVTKTLTTHYTFSNSSTIAFGSAPANGEVIKITRSSNRNARLVDYQDGSTLTEASLDQDGNQAFFMAQEAIDITEGTLNISTSTDQWDANSKRITNVANPTSDQDVATKHYLENTWLSATDKATLNSVNSNISNINSVNSNASNINSAVSNATNINTVATNIGSVNTVATDITKVVAVANDLAEAVSEIETVADDLNESTSEIDVVSNNIANVNTVGGISSDVTTVAGISSAVSAVNSNSSNINAVNSNSSNINTVAGDSAEINSVAGISSDVTAVAGISSAVSAVNSNSSNINAVNSNSANINTVAGNNTNINTVAGANANISSVATNLASVNNFAEQYRISSSAPTSSLNVGDLYFDTTANELKVYKSSGWAAAGSTVNGTSQRFTYIISGTPSSVTGSDANGNTLAYDAGFADVYLNGVRLSSSDITITSGTSVVFASALANGDVVDVVAYGTFNVASIDASNIDSGTVSNSRLSSDVTQNTATQTLTNKTLTTPIISSISNTGTLTIPTSTDTLVGKATTDIFTNKSIDLTDNTVSGTLAEFNTAVSDATLVSTAGSETLTNKTVNISSNTFTVDGTDAVGFRNTPVVSKSADYTMILTDGGKTIYHPSSDNNARTFTIPANASVAYPIGTVITFINLASANLSIAITSDTMNLAADGTTGTRTLAQYGVATAIKLENTNWFIGGVNLS